jgi:hypothetical protein
MLLIPVTMKMFLWIHLLTLVPKDNFGSMKIKGNNIIQEKSFIIEHNVKMKTIFAISKTIVHKIKIIMVILKLLYINESKKKKSSGWPKSVFGPKIVFLCENIEKNGKVLSGNKNYFWVPKIIFRKNPIFGLTGPTSWPILT